MISLQSTLFKLCLGLGLFLLFVQTSAAQNFTNQKTGVGDEHEKIVLVCINKCEGLELGPMRLRKLFLGMPVKEGQHYLKPLVNVSDKQLENVFYQSIVAMSRKSFQAKTLMQKLRFAFKTPSQFEKQSLLLKHLQKAPASITYMWQHDAEQLESIHIIRTLWKGIYLEN